MDDAICDNEQYFQEVKQRWKSIYDNPYKTRKQFNVAYSENNYDVDSSQKKMDEFTDLLKFLTKRGQYCGLFKDSVDNQGNGYRYFITVRRPMIKGKVQNCTIDDFAITDKTWNTTLDKYLAVVWKVESNNPHSTIGVGTGSAIWKSATLSYLNNMYQVTPKGLGLFDAINAERSCMSTNNRIGKLFGFSPKSTPVAVAKAIPIEEKYKEKGVDVPIAEATYVPVDAVPVPVAEAVRVNAGGRKTRRHNKSKRTQKSKRSRKSKRRKHRKTRK